MRQPTAILDDSPGAQNAHSPDFKRDRATVSSSVNVDRDRNEIDRNWRQLSRSTSVERCLVPLFKAAAAGAVPDLTFTAASAKRFAVNIGSRSVGYAVTLSGNANGIAATLYIDLVFVVRDRAEVDLDAIKINRPFDRSTAIALARIMYNRLGSKAT